MVSRSRRVLGYVRVSSLGQATEDKKSLDDQRASIARYAASIGAKVHEPIFCDMESGAKEDRAQALACIAEARPGDVVIVDKIDRFSRDQVWGLSQARELVDRGIGFYSVAESLDASTPQGKSMLGIMLWAAEQERERIKVRMVGNRKLRRVEGLYSEGKTPRGYRRQEDGPRKNVLLIDTRTVGEVWGEKAKPLTAHMRECDAVREAFKWAIEGKTQREIRDGLEVWKTADVLHNRVYLGELRKSGAYVTVRDDNGKPELGRTGKALKRRDKADTWIKGQHEPLITVATFNATQEAIASRVRKRVNRTAKVAWFLVAGHAYCAKCGAAMIGTWADNTTGEKKHITPRVYYKCFGVHRDGKHAKPCKPGKHERSQVPAKAVDAMVRGAITLHLSRVRHVLEHGAPKEKAPVNVDAKRKALTTKRERTANLYADGAITRDDMRERIAKLDGELAALGEPTREVPASERREAMSAFDAWRKKLDAALDDPRKGPAIVAALLERVEVKRPYLHDDQWLIPAPVYTWRLPDDAHLTSDGLAKFLPRIHAIGRLLG